jgi:hypothetical protein
MNLGLGLGFSKNGASVNCGFNKLLDERGEPRTHSVLTTGTRVKGLLNADDIVLFSHKAEINKEVASGMR